MTVEYAESLLLAKWRFSSSLMLEIKKKMIKNAYALLSQHAIDTHKHSQNK